GDFGGHFRRSSNQRAFASKTQRGDGPMNNAHEQTRRAMSTPRAGCMNFRTRSGMLLAGTGALLFTAALLLAQDAGETQNPEPTAAQDAADPQGQPTQPGAAQPGTPTGTTPGTPAGASSGAAPGSAPAPGPGTPPSGPTAPASSTTSTPPASPSTSS